MKRWISFFGHLAIITVLTSFATLNFEENKEVPDTLKVSGELSYTVNPISENVKEEKVSIFLGKTFLGFKEAVAFKESQGSYTSINTLGYLGKYQFGAGTLKLMGVHDTDKFINTPQLQETLFEMNVARNKWILRRDIKRFVDKKINGTLVTESGIIAAAHLAGAGNVKKYLRSYGQQDFSDAYGSTIAYYLKRFGGYNISQIKATHNPRI